LDGAVRNDRAVESWELTSAKIAGWLAVKKALGKVPGVADTKIDLGKKTATVIFDPDKANLAALVKATTDAGFPSSTHK